MQLFALFLLALPFIVDANEVPRIIGGRLAYRYEFPHQISMQYHNGWEWEHFCGGSIIKENFIVTAAHCVYEYNPNIYYRIVAGILCLGETSEDVQIRTIKKLHIHGNYVVGDAPMNFISVLNDIAILELNEPLHMTKAVRKIEIWDESEDPEGVATASGWGYTTMPLMQQFRAEPSEILKADNYTIISPIKCKLTHPHLHELEQICIQSGNPRLIRDSPCMGDSGGPLTHNNKLIGVASYTDEKCSGGPTVYTKPYKHLDFIQSCIQTN